MTVSLILTLTVLYNTVLIWIIAKYHRPQQPGRNYVWSIVFLSLWTLGAAITNFPESSKNTVIFVARAMHIVAAGFAVCWIWFCSDISGQLLRNRKLLIAITFTAIPWLAIAWTDKLIIDSSRQPWNDYLIVGLLTPIYTVWILITCAIGFYFLVKTERRSHGYLRLQLRYIIVGTACVWLSAVTTCLILPIFSHHMDFSIFGQLCSIITTTTTTYALTRGRLMDIKILYRFGASLLLTYFFLILLLVLLTFTTSSTNYGSITPSNAILLFLLVAILQPIWRFASHLVNRFVLRTIDRDTELDSASMVLSASLEPAKLIEALARSLQKMHRPCSLSIYASLPDHSGYINALHYGEVTNIPDTIEQQEPVFSHLKTHDEVLVTDELLRMPLIPLTLGQTLQSWSIAMICPMISRGVIHGVIYFGEKRSAEIYTARDISQIHSLAKHAALALENAFLFEETRQLNQQLEQRVTLRTEELQIANTQLHYANETLRKNDEEKNEFLAYLSHELLTPLTSIIGWVEVALLHKNPDITKQSFQVIHRNAWRQKQLVDELIALSRMIYQKLELELQIIDFRTIVEEVYESASITAQARGISIHCTLPSSPITITGDTRRLIQITHNLVNNAIKYSNHGENIRLSLNQDTEYAHLVVEDTGHGIEAEHLPRIFEPFTQYARNDYYGGLGLGLALVKGITELHHGQVNVVSDGPGKGSTFTVSLPRIKS